jgi:hypothetical protein
VYGTNLQLITKQCCVCRAWVALRVDPDDLKRHVEGGVFVQHAFIGRDGKSYLSSSERELFLSGVCGECWSLLCPSGDPLAYN